MSSSKLNNPQSEKKSRRARARRSSTSLSDQKPRNRALWELIEITNLLLEKGSLSNFDETAENAEDLLSIELGIKLQMKQNAVKKVMKLRGLGFNDVAWNFLRDSSSLGVFSEFHFTKPYGTIKNNGGTLSLDFLEAFINGKDPVTHESYIQNQSRTRKLDAIALSYSAQARDFVVTMFLKSVAVISTLCSFIPEMGNMTWSQIMDIIGRYTSTSWDSSAKQREYHNDVNMVHLVDGWHIVSEVYKIQVQELHLQKTSSNKNSGNSARVEIHDVEDKICEFTKHVVCEFMAWCVVFLREDHKAEHASDIMLDTLDELYEKLCGSIGAKPIEEDTIREDYIASLIENVVSNHPTMAEIKYECKEMTPSRRETRLNFSKRAVVWNTADVFSRCRWDASSASQVYKNFLEQKAQDNEKAELEPQQPEKSMPNPAPEDMGTLHTTPPEKNDVELPLKRNSADMTEYEHIRKIRDETRRKRLKAVQEAASRRLGLALQQERVARGQQLKNRYCDDGDSSDEEKRGAEAEGPSSPEKSVTLEVNLLMQLLYELILDWPVFPDDPGQDGDAVGESLAEFTLPVTKAGRAAACDLLTGDERFVGIHSEMRYTNFFTDVTKARNISRYAEHWRHTLPFEIRGMVSDAISELLPTVKADPRKKNDWAHDIDKDRYLNLVVEKSNAEKGLLNVTCRSTNPLLSKRIVTELQGGTLCVGYVTGLRYRGEGQKTVRGGFLANRNCASKKVEHYSTLVLMACRRLHWDRDDEFDMARERGVNEVTVHLAVSRDRMKHIKGIWANDTIRLLYLCPLTPHVRMFKSVQEVCLLPEETHRVLCGPPEQRPIVPTHDVLVANVDKGCYDYLINVRKTTNFIDESQMHALLTVLGNIGGAKCGSSSVSLIQGPPGTGKTTLLNILIGALLHHSTYGHVKGEQVHMLKEELGCDGILRRTTNPEALGILVCAGSNQAVDNFLGRMDEQQGIPDGRGGGIHPQSVRLARQGYDYGSLKKYSINEKALPFDTYVHHRNQPGRVTASSAARRSFARELVVGFTTCSTSGGARLKNVMGNWDIVIVDEAGQINEPETIIPVVNAYKRNIHRRSHIILCGDHKQLPPMVSAMWMMKKHHKLLPFSYPTQMMSLFERLERTQRCPFSMLTTQYRSHPCIAKLVSSTFYEGAVKSIRLASEFADKYNAGPGEGINAFGPVTLIDTSKLPSRFEHNDLKGGVENMLELDIIKEILGHLRDLAGNTFHHLRGQIAILAPYRGQVKLIRDMLERDHLYKTTQGPTRKGFELLVDTVDSMQGDQRDVVIFSATRSNNDQTVGFVDKTNRLNVAISRSRKLLIIVADMSTLSVNREFNIFWNYAAHGCNDAVLLVRQPGRPGDDTGFSQRFLRSEDEIREYYKHAKTIGQI